MKREADGDMGAPHKRSRKGDEEVRLLIPSKVAGSIIGKGGQNITRLRSKYKASITVPDCPGPERMLTLSSDLDTICNVVNDVVPNLEEYGNSQNGARTNGDELDLRMMIDMSHAGCVIGKGGYKIKELREKTGARIKIFSSCAPQSTDRIVQIVGKPSKCIDSIREIVTLIKSNPIKGSTNPYDPHNYDDFYAGDYGGYGMRGKEREGGGGGGGGGRFNNRGPPPRGGPMGGHMGGPPPPRGGGYGGPPPPRGGMGGPYERNDGWGGPMNGGGGGGNMMNQPPPNMLPPGNLGGGMGGGGMGGMSQGPMGGMGQGSQGMGAGNMGGGGGMGGGPPGGKTSTQVTIPKDLAGAIIGKGGGRIRKIRTDSGAAITIDEPLPGSNDRIITITGLHNQIQMAQYLLQQSVHDNNDRNNY